MHPLRDALAVVSYVHQNAETTGHWTGLGSLDYAKDYSVF